ncbi:MAG: hypothetical protein P9L97_13535 [Candidatus Tenebribacter davisii]|nr:hypothetical protein [Candidatus Tenebribacter davisii]
MRKIFVFPASNHEAQVHLKATIINPISKEIIKSNLKPDDMKVLDELHINDYYAWGATPGPSNKRNWIKMEKDDEVLTYFNKKYHYYSTVLYKIHNENLARELWGELRDGKTWEYIYFLSHPKKFEKPLTSESFSDYLPKIFQGFSKVKDDKTEKIIRKYGSVYNLLSNYQAHENVLKYWFVCQGKTFTPERGQQYLWAPKKSKDGRSLYHWENMKKVKKGDIIINYANGFIQGISNASTDYYDSINPKDDNDWSNEGYKVDISYTPFEYPLSIKSNTNIFTNVLRGVQGPFDKDDNVKQGYLFEFNKKAYTILQNLIQNQYGGAKMVQEKSTFSSNKFSNDVNNSGLYFDKKLVYRFISSLLSKPFVILTGLSGSGKTKLAQAFASWICKIDESRENQLAFSLPINKSAIDHRGWSLPVEVRKNFVNWIKKDVSIIIDGQEVEAHIDNILELYYNKNLDLNLKYNIGDRVDVILKNPISSNVNTKQYKLIPVGADWTNREPLLGYPNALDTGKYVKPENSVLDLILNAIENPEKPYFLILDEMNLSHVERYFADFLSAMESEEEIPLHPDSKEWKDKSGNWNDGIPASIKLPSNLFIIGTVNIDETTYMFSPKVLDRANVIEFRVTDKELNEFLKNPARPDLDFLKGKGEAMAADFVKLAKAKAQNSDDSDKVKETLLEFFRYLKIAGAEFGYRTAFEISKFCAKLSLITQDNMWEIDEKLDAAIMQKLLPKLHGSRKKLEPVLNSLAILCLVDNEKQRLLTAKKDKNQNIGNLVDEAVEIEENIHFKLSMEKIIRMKKRVIQDGFTSFAEA